MPVHSHWAQSDVFGGTILLSATLRTNESNCCCTGCNQVGPYISMTGHLAVITQSTSDSEGERSGEYIWEDLVTNPESHCSCAGFDYHLTLIFSDYLGCICVLYNH